MVGTLGFRNLIHTPLQPRIDPNLKIRLMSAYVSAVKAAHDQKATSLAIPVLTGIPALSPAITAKIAHEAMRHCLTDSQTAENLPRIFLVFPNNSNGRSQYKEHLRMNR